MADGYIPDVTMEGIRIAIRNFSGIEKQYNPKGKRNFLAMVDHETAEAMKADGWNIKYLPAREEGDQDQPFLKVNVNYDNDPEPRIILISQQTGKQTVLDADTVGLLDGAELVNVDLLVHPSRYEVRGETGVSAYLRKGYFTIVEDALDLKYGHGLGSGHSGTAVLADADLPIVVADNDTPF